LPHLTQFHCLPSPSLILNKPQLPQLHFHARRDSSPPGLPRSMPIFTSAFAFFFALDVYSVRMNWRCRAISSRCDPMVLSLPTSSPRRDRTSDLYEFSTGLSHCTLFCCSLYA